MVSAPARTMTVAVYTDSTYVRNGITRWIAGWKRNGWVTQAKKPVKNSDLWRRLDQAAQTHDVEWRWVKGHAGDAGNERADALARKGVTVAVPAVPPEDDEPAPLALDFD